MRPCTTHLSEFRALGLGTSVRRHRPLSCTQGEVDAYLMRQDQKWAEGKRKSEAIPLAPEAAEWENRLVWLPL